jgi:hypothetical protein
VPLCAPPLNLPWQACKSFLGRKNEFLKENKKEKAV